MRKKYSEYSTWERPGIASGSGKLESCFEVMPEGSPETGQEVVTPDVEGRGS